MTDLAALAAEVVAEVEHILASGKTERLILHVNPHTGNVAIVPPPDREVVTIQVRKAA